MDQRPHAKSKASGPDHPPPLPTPFLQRDSPGPVQPTGRGRGRGAAIRPGGAGHAGEPAEESRPGSPRTQTAAGRPGGHGDAQRTGRPARLDAHLVDNASAQRLLEDGGRELGQALDGLLMAASRTSTALS